MVVPRVRNLIRSFARISNQINDGYFLIFLNDTKNYKLPNLQTFKDFEKYFTIKNNTWKKILGKIPGNFDTDCYKL